MKVVISHPTGNTAFRAAALGLKDAGILASLQTTVATFPGNIFDKLSTFGPFAELDRRRYDSSLVNYTKSWPWYELARFAATKAGLKNLVKHETGIFSVDAVYKNLDKRVAKSLKKVADEGSDAIYAYEDGALFSFLEAKRLHFKCLYDLPIGYWRAAKRLLEVENERWPEWKATLTGLEDSAEKLGRKDEELRLADKIFVASHFTANTLKDYPGKLAPIEIIPYAFPPVAMSRSYDTASTSKPLKLLFVGGLSQRKGIADLFAVAENLKTRVELTVVGKKSSDECPALDAALKKHHWIPSLPHQEILVLMKAHDVLVFPSLFEGFGLVITEAMSQGTPVITTDRTAGPDLIKHGENGWIIEAGSTNALQAAIEELLQKPNVVAEVGREAMKTAEKRTWDVYQQELIQAINQTR